MYHTTLGLPKLKPVEHEDLAKDDCDAASTVSGKWIAATLYIALTVLFAAPLSLRPARMLPADNPDAHLFMWTLAWDAHAFTHQPLSLFDANIFFPNHGALAYSENLIGSALFATPILWLTGNPVLAVNLVSLLSCVLCGLGAYVLGRRLGLSAPAAFLCGLIFAFSPPRFFRFSQLHLTVVQWVPFALGCLHAYLDRGRPRDLHLAIMLFTLQALSSGHGALFLLIAMGIVLTCRFALGEPVRLLRRLTDFGVVGAMTILPAVLLFLPYRSAQLDVGLRRGLTGSDTAPASFLASPSHLHVWIASHIAGTNFNTTATAYLFPGYLPLVLALAAVAWRVQWRARIKHPTAHRTWAWITRGLDVAVLTSVIVAVIVYTTGRMRLAVGGLVVLEAKRGVRVYLAAAIFVALRVAVARSLAHVRTDAAPDGNQTRQRWTAVWRRDPVLVYLLISIVAVGLSLGAPLGLWPLVYRLPGFNFIRVPSRFVILGLLGVAVLAGVGFDCLTAGLRSTARLKVAAVVGLFLVAEFAAIPLSAVPYQLDLPAADRWLARQPKPFAVAEIPTTGGDRNESVYMLHSMAHWQKTVHGYSGIRPQFHEDLYRELRDFPTQDSVQRLAELGVTYVVVHLDWFPLQERATVEQRLRSFKTLTLAYLDSDARVYSIGGAGPTTKEQ